MFGKKRRAAQQEMLAGVIGIMPTEKGNILLFADRVMKQNTGQTMMLNEFTSAEFSEIGGVHSRGTLTRAATVGGGWQKEIDNRQMILTISNGTDMWMEDVTPSMNMARNNFRLCANKFAMQVNMQVTMLSRQST